jgi:hypothetical protein
MQYAPCMKKLIALALTAISLLSSLPQAEAMGSGNKYSDLQTGVTYGIYEPSNTLSLPALNFEVRPCRLFPKKDEYLLAGYGGMDHGITLVQTSALFNCTGLDHPKSLGTTMINGVKAEIGIYCSGTKCTSNNFSKFGGEITFTMPKTKFLAATFIRIGSQGGFTLQQLTTFAKGLKLVGKK